jgi:hypothetical protein
MTPVSRVVHAFHCPHAPFLAAAPAAQLRKLWASEASKQPILEFHLQKALDGLGVTMDQFVDICILAGCDYAEQIKGAREGRRSGWRRCANLPR